MGAAERPQPVAGELHRRQGEPPGPHGDPVRAHLAQADPQALHRQQGLDRLGHLAEAIGELLEQRVGHASSAASAMRRCTSILIASRAT